MLTKNDTSVLSILDSWRDHMRAVDEQIEVLRQLLGCAPESPLPNAVGAIQGELTRQVAARIDWSEDALLDWWLVHNFGENPMRAGFSGEPMREIANNADLAAFIAECV